LVASALGLLSSASPPRPSRNSMRISRTGNLLAHLNHENCNARAIYCCDGYSILCARLWSLGYGLLGTHTTPPAARTLPAASMVVAQSLHGPAPPSSIHWAVAGSYTEPVNQPRGGDTNLSRSVLVGLTAIQANHATRLGTESAENKGHS
jgi:hypothetical protein